MRQGTEQALDLARKTCADAGIPAPYAEGPNFLKWDREDGGYVIFRASYNGSFGTLDARWREDDGQLNGPVAPATYDYLPYLARDVEAFLSLPLPTREMVRKMGKA